MTEWHSLTHSVRKKATGTTSTACRANFELIKLIECDKYEIQYMYVKRKNQHFLEIMPEAQPTQAIDPVDDDDTDDDVVDPVFLVFWP